MATSTLEQYRIADFLEWHSKKILRLNPEFQRRAVWTPAARIFLIDTILRQFPIPKVYMRTQIDVRSKGVLREVVDGQQRLRAIIDFSEDKFALSKRAKDFTGLRYSTLPSELQERFLSYPIAVDQLVNASDSEVLEVFARLNSYNVTLNSAELRHARFSGDFKWAVHEAAKRWDILWSHFEIVSKRQRLRMADDALMAEMFGVLLHGVASGDQRAIDRLYSAYDADFTEEQRSVKALDQTLTLITQSLAPALVGPLVSPPHFLMLFAASAHALIGLPPGQMGDQMPARDPAALTDVETALQNLAHLAAAIEATDVEGPLGHFVRASLANAHRMQSRQIRFPVYCKALLPHVLAI